MIAGGISAGPTTLIMSPVERVKVLLQIQGQGGENKYKGPIDVVRQLYKEGGLRSIYRGFGATLARDGPGSAAYFGAYEITKKLLTPANSTPDSLNPAAILFAGGNVS
jgi:solute carrier family 25 carnitine/acylcarnitine transporter 20/29